MALQPLFEFVESSEQFQTRKKKEKKKQNAKLRKIQKKLQATEIVRVLNLGAGVQSTALILMDSLVHRQDRRSEVESWLGQSYPYPPLDFAVFADTQDEPSEVYRHLEKLKQADTTLILEGTRGRLGDDLIAGRNSSGQSFASIPAFTSETEGEEGGMTRRQCTSEYKIVVVERIIRRVIFGLDPGRTIPSNSKVVQWFGLSFDEPGRIARVKARVDATGWAEPLFPLAELEMERSDCLRFLESIAWTAPRSACVFCPFKSNAEWRHLHDTDSEGWTRAIEVDRAIRDPQSACTRNLVQKLYVHRSCVPLEFAPIDVDMPMLGFLSECEGMCGS